MHRRDTQDPGSTRHRRGNSGLRRVVVGCLAMAATAFACCGGFAASASAALSWTLSAPTTLSYSNADLPSANMLQVGCSAPGTCTAVGVNAPSETTPTGSAETYMVAAQEVNGTWDPATTVSSVSLPADTGVSLTLSGIYCASAGSCIVVGTASTYSENDNQTISTYEPFYVVEAGGSWGGMQSIAFPGNAFVPTGGFAGSTPEGGTTDLACASASHCVVTGYYSDSGINGAPSPTSVPMASVGSSSGFGGFQQTSITGSVACVPQSTTCTVLGKGSAGGYGQLAVQTEDNGSWSAAQTITSGDGANGQGTIPEAGIACPAAGDCVVSGDYPSTYATEDLFTMQETNATWGSPQGIGDGQSPNGGFIGGQMQCISVGNCVWGGQASDVDESGQNVYYYTQSIVAEDTDGTWAGFRVSPVPSGAIAPPSSDESSEGVSCAGSRCDVVGFYTSNPGSTYVTQITQPYAFSDTLALPPSATAVACSLLTNGTTNYSCTASVSDASGESPLITPTQTVTLSTTVGTFPNGDTCTMAATGTTGTASCSLEYDPGEGYGSPVTITGAYSGDDTFSSSQGQLTFTPGCEQDPTETDGDWQFGGCFTQPDTTDFDTQQQSNLDGMPITPSSSSSPVDYSTGGSGGTSLAPSGSTSLALNVSNISGGSQGLVTLTNQLQKLNLAGGPVTIPLASGFNLLGLPLTGSITFTPQGGGTAVGTVSGTLPGILGGGPATVTVTTSFSGQVTSVVATATSGTLANVFGLSSLKLTYANSTWSVAATAKGANNTTQQMTGSISFNSAGKVTAGNLSISNVVIAGLLQIKTFTVTYSATAGWSGSASLAQGGQNASVSITIDANGTMTAGSISASGITLFQVFTLKTFTMTYNAGKWGLTLAIEGKKGAPALTTSLSVGSDGTVLGASLDLKNVSMLGKIAVDDLNLTYTHAANGDDIFTGGAEVSLPSSTVSKVKGTFKMVNGLLTEATLDADTNIPLYGALVLTHVGGKIVLSPRKQISGNVSLSAGPKVAGHTLLSLKDGTIEYDFPATDGGAGTYKFSGDLTAADKTLGHGEMTVDDGIAKLKLTLGDKDAGFKFGGRVSANGSITGAIHHSTFTLSGKVQMGLRIAGHDYTTGGELLVSNNGILACSAAPITAISSKGDSGLLYAWTGEITTYAGDCPR